MTTVYGVFLLRHPELLWREEAFSMSTNNLEGRDGVFTALGLYRNYAGVWSTVLTL